MSATTWEVTPSGTVTRWRTTLPLRRVERIWIILALEGMAYSPALRRRAAPVTSAATTKRALERITRARRRSAAMAGR